MTKPKKTLFFIFVTFFSLALCWNFVVPPYENLDELEHAEVVRHIVVTGRLPVHNEAEADGFNVRQEASQPPLYHLTAAAWTAFWHLPTDAHSPEPIPTDIVACGATDTFYNKATWIHDPQREKFPWSGSILTLHSLRMFSTLLQIATIAGVWTLARRVFLKGPVPTLAAVLVACNPQYLLLSAGVNNDNIITPLATWGLVLIYDVWNREDKHWRFVLLGIVCGLAGLSKLSGIGLLGLTGIVILLRGLQKKLHVKHLAVQGSFVLVPFLIFVSPWFIRNIQLYNDPTALAPMLEKVGYRPASSAVGELRLMFLSYWGQLPCSFYPRALYWPYFVLAGGGLLGLVIGWRQFNTSQKNMLGLCLAWFSLIVVAWMRWNSMTYATGGRLLFPAIAALGLILASGWWVLIPRFSRLWAAFLPLWVLITLVAGPVLIFSKPKQVQALDPAAHPTELTFGDSIALQGYKAGIRKDQIACLLISESYCDPLLDLTLYWQTKEPIMSEETMVIQLVSPEPGNTTLRFNYNHWPGKGNYPTSAWQQAITVSDRYLFPLPTVSLPTGGWKPQLAFVDPETGQRLPVFFNNQYLGDAAQLDILRVPGLLQDYPDWGNPAVPVKFSDAVILQDAVISSRQEDSWTIELFWECENQLADNYTVFVHAYDVAGNLLATGDMPPQTGGFPTSLWQPGDRILDIHNLPNGETPTASVAIGMYHPLSGERLHAVHSGTPLPNDAVIIWRTSP